MSTYLRVLENHKRRRVAFVDNTSNLRPNSLSELDDIPLFPETMFTLNCVPDSAVLQTSGLANHQKLQFNGVLDNLPQIMTKSTMISPIMIERLGIRPEFLNMEQTRGRSGSMRIRGEEQATQISKKVVARLLTNVGFESCSDSSLEVLPQLLSCHIGKLGRTLKLLSDSYRKQCSANELVKMFLQTAGYSNNMGALVQIIKDNTKNGVQPNQQQVQAIQAQLQMQQQPSILPSQQIPRQINPQMQQQMNNAQYLAFQQQQQQWERMRRRQQQPAPRPGMNTNVNMNMNMNTNTNVNMNMNTNTNMIDKDNRPLVQVKMENPSEFPLDANAFAAVNSRHPQLLQIRHQQEQQLAQQQLAQQVQANNNNNNNVFRPMTSLQIPQILSPSMSMPRAPPVKVEGFQELMGGDSSIKHDSEENKLLSPQK
ncbi:hypothetical protein ABFX02_08G214200 [Erythranthe guttata]